jgi:hypothetical protein
VAIAAVLLAALGAAVFFALGMHRGILLSTDIYAVRAPWGGVLPPRTPQAPALSDAVWQFVPWTELARRELLAGRLPLWNPHQDGGAPLLGNAVSALLSPLAWPALAAGVARGWNLSLLARILLAAAGAWAFLRDLSRSRTAAAFGAVVFSLSGPLIAWLEHPLALAAAPVPFLLLFARRAARDGTPRSVAGVAGAAFLVLAGGHPETALQAALLAAAAALAAARSVRRLLAAAAGGLLGAALAAPMLLPFAEYYLRSAARLGAGRRAFVLSARDLLRFVAPRLPGSNVIEAAATVSIVGLFFALLGLARLRRDREARFWAAAAAAILLAVYDSPVSRALAVGTPVYWTRLLLLFPIAIAVLASGALDDLRALAAPRFRRAAALGAAAAVAVSAFELLAAARGVHAVNASPAIAPGTPLLAAVAADRDVFRILPLHTMLSPDSATLYGLDDVRGYDALAPAAWRARRAAMGRFADLPTQRDALEPWDVAPGGAALDFWNVKYLLLPPRFAFGAATLNAKKGLDLEEVYAGPDGRLLRNRRVLPRVRLDVPGEARVVERVPTRWRIAARAGAPGRLVVANPWFPGWTARVDGAEVALAAAAGAPVAVPLPAGRHVVELRYRPGSFRAGVSLAALAAAALAVLLFTGRASRGDPTPR